jgi:hypothetical protein
LEVFSAANKMQLLLLPLLPPTPLPLLLGDSAALSNCATAPQVTHSFTFEIWMQKLTSLPPPPPLPLLSSAEACKKKVAEIAAGIVRWHEKPY